MVLVELRDFAFAHYHSAHAGANDHAHAMGRRFIHGEIGVGERFLAGHEGELRVAIHPIGLLRRQVLFRRKP
jgi:hypothetical protein